MLSFNQQQILDGFRFHPFVLSLLGLLSLYFVAKRLYKNPSLISNKKLPPSPPKLPVLGNLHQLSTLAHRSFQSLGTKHGPVMLIHFGNTPAVIVQSANAAKEIMKTNDLIFADKPHTRTTRRLFYDLKDISVAPYGEYWRKLKSICVLQLLNSKRVQSFGFIREEETALLMEKINESSKNLELVNLSELFVSITNDVICRAVFGRKYSEGEGGKRFLMLLRKVLELMGSMSIGEFIPWLSWINYVNGFDREVDRVAREVDGFLEMVIQEHMSNEGVEISRDESRENFVDILMNLYKDDKSDVSVDRDGIKAIILDIIAGGTDTTSATLEWTMSELLRHPIALKTLQNEVREITRGKNVITENDLSKMHYLKAVVKETLRLHPPIPFLARVAREDVKLMGYDISIGTMIITNTWAIGRDSESWNEPEKFMPERFLTSSVDFKGLDFELIPFGAGRRGCPGVTFAMAGIELMLANVVQKFEWELPKGTTCEGLDMTEQAGVTTHRKNPLLAVATPCSDF
ncbi:hypothetical protein ABFX02_09G012700 [Erythranthe guttata]